MLLPNAQREAGNFSRVVSLAGSLGKIGFGRQMVVVAGTAAGATEVRLSGFNTQRIAALIQNTGANTAILSFGGANTEGVTLLANASFQIDALFPWTGQLVLYSAAGTTYNFVEVSNMSD